MSTKNELIEILASLGWEAIQPVKTVKAKYEEAIETVKKGKTPAASTFRTNGKTPTSSEAKNEDDSQKKEDPPKKKILTKKEVIKSPKKNEVAPKDSTEVAPKDSTEVEVVAPTTEKSNVSEVETATTPQVATISPKKETESLPLPQQRVEKNLIFGNLVIKSEDLLSVLDSASSLSSNDYTSILMKLSSYCSLEKNQVSTTRKQISSVTTPKNLDATKDEYLLFKKHYTPQISATTIAEKSGIDISKIYSMMFNSAKYASAYRD
jgi:hypothetical protein